MRLQALLKRAEGRRPPETQRHVEPLSPWEQATVLASFYRRVGTEAGVNLAGTVSTLQRALDSGDASAMASAVTATAGSLEVLT